MANVIHFAFKIVEQKKNANIHDFFKKKFIIYTFPKKKKKMLKYTILKKEKKPQINNIKI